MVGIGTLLLGLALAQGPEARSTLDDVPVGTWVKLSPLDGTPVSPRLGYEGACAWDSRRRVLIRYGGHNQGGGGEQHSEVWTFEPTSRRWTLLEPNTSPPGVCCAQQNVFDPVSGRYLRFPSFSGSHGWQWWREIYLNDSTVWSYDPADNTWRNHRPLPTPEVRPLRCASWDEEHQVVVVFGGETSQEGTLTYHPYSNTWTRKRPPLEPASRSGGNLAYDSAHRVHVLFGSQFSDDPHTWIYDLAANRWRDAKPEVQPPTDRNDAVLAYDRCSGKVVAIVKVTTGEDDSARHRLETWTYDVGENRWARLDPQREPDPSGNRARVLVAAPELGGVLLENRTHPPHGPSEQQIWILRLPTQERPPNAEPPRPESLRIESQPSQPRCVEDLVVSVRSPRRVEVRWAPLEDPQVLGYTVERAPVDVLTEDQLVRLKGRTPPLGDPSVGGIRAIGEFRTLTSRPVTESSYVDDAVHLDSPRSVEEPLSYERRYHDEHIDRVGRAYRFAVHAYRVRPVRRDGTRGGPSEAVLTIPSAPQHLASREDGATCHLRWAPNPEAGIRGYRVYRMNGRFDNADIPRLTLEPVSETRYADASAGTATRRYYVVAVDALGQEGFPSCPVWFDREWKAYYEPFVGEWHS